MNINFLFNRWFKEEPALAEPAPEARRIEGDTAQRDPELDASELKAWVAANCYLCA